MFHSVPTVLLAFEKSALKMALSVYPIESSATARIRKSLTDSGEHDSEVVFQENDITFICESLTPWAQESLHEELPDTTQREMAQRIILELAERLTSAV